LGTKACTVAILNYNGEAWLRTFLPGVVQHTEGAQLLVYDNCSTDGSVAYIRQHHPEVLLIEGKENLGFCGGYNQAFKHIETPYTVLLNSDVEVTPHWLEPLVAELHQHPDVAAVQPKIKSYAQRTHFEYAGAAGGYLDALGYPFCRGRIFETIEEDKGQYDTPQDVFWASGACLAIKTHVFKKLGGFDERFFAHMEEVDLCWRAQRAGYRIRVVPSSMVYHVGGGTLSYGSMNKLRLNFRNNLLMLSKNLSGWAKYRVLGARLVLDGVAALAGLAKGQWGAPWAILQAHAQFYRLTASNKPDENPKIVKPSKIYILQAYYLQKRKIFSDLGL
jgi:GT2 family glycosyltransferase